MIRRKTAAIVVAASIALVLASCQSTETPFGQGGYQRVQVIDIQGGRKVSDDVPLSAVIQPEDLMVSPVIDITTLQEIEMATDSVVSSSTLQQAERKAEIEAQYAAGEKIVDSSLDESEYGLTSGSLATKATEEAFQYIDSETAFQESIAEYDYIPGRIYELITSPKAITDLRLRPNEQIAGSPITNDSANWQFSMGSSIEDGQPVQHIFIRPLKVGLDTSMIMLTNERTYYFRLASFEDSYMTALRFRYPQMMDDGTFVEEGYDGTTADLTGYSFDPAKADYDYLVKETKGDPAWTPVTVFSDDIKTYIQFPVTMTNSDKLPSVYILDHGDENLVNYRLFGNLYQIDNVLTGDQKFRLKSGQKEQVEIKRAY